MYSTCTLTKIVDFVSLSFRQKLDLIFHFWMLAEGFLVQQARTFPLKKLVITVVVPDVKTTFSPLNSFHKSFFFPISSKSH